MTVEGIAKAHGLPPAGFRRGNAVPLKHEEVGVREVGPHLQSGKHDLTAASTVSVVRWRC
jgi:hypothetical protein